MSDTKLEALAAYAHEAWSGWMTYLFRLSMLNEDGTAIISADRVERWQRQMTTDYADLPESEKASGRAEALKILSIVGDTSPPNIPGAVQVMPHAGMRITLNNPNWPASENVSGKVYVLLGARRHEYYVNLGIFTSKSAADEEMRLRESSDDNYDIYDVEEWELNKPEPIQAEDAA